MNPQYNYENAYLHIKGMPCEWELHLKPKPYAQSRMPGRSWKPDSPDFNILAPADKPDLSMDLFRSDIPENYISIIEPFPSHQWMMLRLLYEGAACLELALSNPVLFYCIANNAEFRSKPEDRITVLGKLCLKKQKELLDWLGFQGTPSTVRLFQKIVPEAVNPSILRMFRAALKTTEFLKALAHMKQINAGVLSLVTNENIAAFLTPKLLLEVSERQDEQAESPVSDLLFETCSMYETIREIRRIKRPAFESVARMQTIHDKFVPQYNEEIAAPVVSARRRRLAGQRRRVGCRRDVTCSQFWDPPILGTSSIIPITSAKELYQEGWAMHNCAGMYMPTIDSGRMYMYRMVEPERATFSIRPNKDGEWFIAQIKGVCNQKVTETTRRVIKEWLGQGKQSSSMPLNKIKKENNDNESSYCH